MIWEQRLTEALRIKNDLISIFLKKKNRMSDIEYQKFEKKMKVVNLEIKTCKDKNLGLNDRLKMKLPVFKVLKDSPMKSFTNGMYRKRNSNDTTTDACSKIEIKACSDKSRDSNSSLTKASLSVAIPDFLQDKCTMLRRKHERPEPSELKVKESHQKKKIPQFSVSAEHFSIERQFYDTTNDQKMVDTLELDENDSSSSTILENLLNCFDESKFGNQINESIYDFGEHFSQESSDIFAKL